MTGYQSKKAAALDKLAQPEQQRVAWTLLLTGEHTGMVGKAGEKFVGAPDYYQRVNVYTTPPQRPWVGLSSVDFNDFNPLFTAEAAARWADAKLRSKNT